MILSVHERILREALGDLLASPSLRAVIRANRRSDFHQLAPHYHFDSAPDPRALCHLWQRGLHTWLSRAVELSAPRDATALRLVDRSGALAAFGRATHALADFYSHTNWLELAVARGEVPQPAPLLEDHCDFERLSAALQSGYFSLRYGMSGCPRSGPPPGFAYCHAQLNKDAPTRGHGAERPAPGGPTYHEMAVQLAIDSTRAAWETLCYRIEVAHADITLSARIIARLAQRASGPQ
jgi:hypothetical protein